MQNRQDSKRASPSGVWINLALSLSTAPVLLGLVLADQARTWLGSLAWEDPGWWLGEKLPNLDGAALQPQLHPVQDNGAPPNHHNP